MQEPTAESEADSLNYWRLCEHLTVIQAALLIAGENPSTCEHLVEEWDQESRPAKYEAAKNFVRNGLRFKELDGKIVNEEIYDSNGYPVDFIEGSVNLEESWVTVTSLRKLLALRGFATGFFFPDGAAAPDYLNSQDPRYAPKLAAAVCAWEALGDPALLRGRSPKKALTVWLRKHAVEFGLTDEEGKQNETGIDEVAKVANWQPKGGAPKTPDDDDIPF